MKALLAVGVVLGANANAEAPKKNARSIDSKADELLHKMSADLDALKTFSFESDQVMEVVTKEGEKIQGLAQSSVSVQRPNKLRADRIGPMGGGSIYYDGKNVTFYGKRDNLYATAEAPNNINDMIDFAREQLSLDAPGADLLHTDSYSVLMDDVVSARYLGEESVGNRKCHHLAYRGHETDFQVWIEDGKQALPCRFVITSKNVKGAPQFTIALSNWKVEDKLEDDTFSFTPPKDAAQINFVSVSDKVTKQKTQARR